MLKIQRLKRPNKHSGDALESGKTVKVRGLSITNNNKFVVRVEKYDRKPWKKTTKKKVRK